ncbi:hypothetical protein J4460_01870 [Candidatus Woesearchaeota archaeon]|nr:MAG: hypothetical protein QS99_C0003G0051 [archaeon GW2011_AR4]MBS3129399.1 hypothetical protein [Candidatus Woesearchaeota archaeon]HIH38440.1 hypothetical protein [Candidatus Woesearchaeota archaeon]HIH48101.1 hypothetical protein [Candidatus Woesearchaeota archaeon]HIJ03453.1 hypothetical protein [Candidatus Woesearchaeota archaeon]
MPADASQFREILVFFDRLGVYDVVLPFILVFTLVFAIFEKTRIFGTDVVDNVTYTKKNLNTMVAFVIAFFVVASVQLVATISQVVSNMVLLLLLAVCFMILVGSFMKEGEFLQLEGGWKSTFMWIMFLGIVLIFLQAIKLQDGTSWLEYLYIMIFFNFNTTAVSSVIMVLFVILLVWLITKDSSPRKKAGNSGD